MPKPLPSNDPAEIERLRIHYELEIELADRLRSSSRQDRQRLYNEAYDELFRRIPWHSQHTRNAETMRRWNRRILRFLRPWLNPEAAVLEIGAGDGMFSKELAPQVRHVYALDVSDGIFDRSSCPENFEFLLSDGLSIPLADDQVDFAFSNQVIEHVHPEDVQPHLREVRRVLRPGGHYLLLTPNRLSGPHDVSGFFSDVARGLHLREYSCGDLAHELRSTGFRNVKAAIKLKTVILRPSVRFPAALERLIELLPRGYQRILTRRAPLAQLVTVRLVAEA